MAGSPTCVLRLYYAGTQTGFEECCDASVQCDIWKRGHQRSSTPDIESIMCTTKEETDYTDPEMSMYEEPQPSPSPVSKWDQYHGYMKGR